MLISTSTAVLALTALTAARPGVGVLRKKRDNTIIGPSAAYQIYKASPDRTFNLVGIPDGSGNGYPSAGTESLINLESATDSPDVTITEAPTSDVASTSMPSASGAASSTSGFIIGFIGARQVISFSPIPSSEAGGIASSVSNVASEGFTTDTPSSLSLPSLTSTDISISSILPQPSSTSAYSTASSEATTPSMTSSGSITSSDSNIPSTTSATSTDSSTLSATSPAVTNEGGISFDLSISQDEGNTNDVDVVVSFSLLCEDTPGPFSFEFDFKPDVGYSAGQINVFKVNGELGASPTYNTVDAATGSLIGTFGLPTDADAEQPKLIYINQLVCEPVINLRFGITDYSSAAGAVAYFNQNGMG